jgi:hypothetical protein
MTENHVRFTECDPQIETRVNDLLAQMTLAEKIGQMCQRGRSPEGNEELIRQGGVGSFLYVLGELTERSGGGEVWSMEVLK